MGDIVSETSDTIFDSIWEDNYDAYYVAMSTENLVGLDVDELHSIADLSVLKRIRDSRQDLLSEEQIKMIEKLEQLSLPSPRISIDELLRILKAYDVDLIERSKSGFEKSRLFYEQIFGKTEQVFGIKFLDLIKNLTIENYVETRIIGNTNSLWDQLFVFAIEVHTKGQKRASIYIKLNQDTQDGIIAALVSFQDTTMASC